jgi:niacin transporter
MKEGYKMRRNNKLYTMVVSALLCAIGIIIPIFSPIKIQLEPASFTLASHVAIFIAMFISPSIAVIVAVGTTIGFFLGGFPIVVVMRAATHVIFASLGALLIKKSPDILNSAKTYIPFSLGIGILHGVCEVIAVIPFYFNHGMSAGYYAKGFVVSVVILVGVGTVIHSMVDFYLSKVIWKYVSKSVEIPKHA